MFYINVILLNHGVLDLRIHMKFAKKKVLNALMKKNKMDSGSFFIERMSQQMTQYLSQQMTQ